MRCVRVKNFPQRPDARSAARRCFSVVMFLALVLLRPNSVALAQEPADAADNSIMFSRPTVDAVRAEVVAWLKKTNAPPDRVQAEVERWADTGNLAAMSGEALLDMVIQSFAAVDAVTQKLLQDSYGNGPLETVVFDGLRNEPFYRNNVNLYRARWYVQHRLYDEAAAVFEELQPDEVVDPAGLLFYRAVCYAEMLENKKAQNSLALLLNNTLDVPARFRIVAKLLQKELSERPDKGLDKVALLMKDVERRLELGRAGEKTQQQEDAVIKAFDDMLEEMEKQQQQQNGGAGGGSQQNQPGIQAADQSQIKGAPAEGKADRKELTEKGRWGMLDKKAEARARELIRQKFPPNFLDQIGQYTRRLAEKQK